MQKKHGSSLLVLALVVFVFTACPQADDSTNGNSAQKPQISIQPKNGVYVQGQAIAPLLVSAFATDSGSLSYQWYEAAANGSGGITINGANGGIYRPILSGIGDYYFYVVVTNTNNYAAGNKTAKTASNYAKITIQDTPAETPHISVQPQSGGYLAEQAIAPLSVTAAVTDGGSLSYQWYSAESSGDAGDAIDNADGTAYQPILNEIGSYYFYVVVTNTNDDVPGNKTAQTVSAYAAVTIYDQGITNANATITVNTADTYQYIRGYGGMDVAWANFPETYIADYETMYDPDKLGYNILRVMIPPGNTNIAVSMEDLTAAYRPYYYDGVKIVNKYGGYVLASPWSPPKEWKTNNSKDGGGSLKHENYQDYANYLKSYAQHMYDKGAPIYVISIQNEPDYAAGYDGCEWTPEEMRDFLKQVGRFTNGVSGYGGGKTIPSVLIMNGESASTPYINLAALQDPVSKAAIDVLGRHGYGGDGKHQSLWNDYHDLLRKDGKMMEVWMTEHAIHSMMIYNDATWDYVWRFMNDIDLAIRRNNENAFVWWAAKRFYGMIGDGQYYTSEGAVLPRGWGLSHYAKYTIDTTRIGFTMTGTTANGAAIGAINADNAPVVNGALDGIYDNTTAKITAFVSADGNEISLVMFTPTLSNGSGGHDLGTIKIDMPDGFEIGSTAGMRSYSAPQNVYHEPYAPLIAADRRSAYVTLPRGHILSVRFTRDHHLTLSPLLGKIRP